MPLGEKLEADLVSLGSGSHLHTEDPAKAQARFNSQHQHDQTLVEAIFPVEHKATLTALISCPFFLTVS